MLLSLGFTLVRTNPVVVSVMMDLQLSNIQSKGFILIVDDNPTNLSVLSHALKDAGFRVRVAMDGESAVEQSIEDLPELILLDIQMPGMDGFETCTQLKANPATREIPVIFITASASIENKVRGLSLGAVDYITKPFQQEEVLARVRVHLKLRYLQQKVQEQKIALLAANRELERIANLDGLTQVANRRRFDDYLEREWRRLARDRQPLSLILCDIDYFKRYNDYYGHQSGDACLQAVAQALEGAVKRPADLVARYGGEEFAVVLPNTTAEGAVHVAKLLRMEVKHLEIVHAQSSASPHVTLSMGVSCMIPTFDTSPMELIAISDKALYVAKDAGRDAHFYMPEAEADVELAQSVESTISG
ncbi:MAG: PleD family two-component system response regulator [Cyanobacteria bacterium P01_D01_bin.123]